MEMTMIRAAMFLGVAAVIAGCALAGPSASAASSAPMSRIESACRALGLDPSDAPYVYCIQSLAASASTQFYAMKSLTQMSDADPDVGINTGYRAESSCAAIGLNPATARYSYCVSNLHQTLFDEQNFLTR
jgi:hypothetical protein